MRKLILLATIVAAFMATQATFSQRANAMAVSSVKSAIDAIELTEQAACWRHGWRGWGWYPCRRPWWRYHRHPRWRRW